MRIARWALIILFLTSSAVYAQFYEWTDKDGVTHITDDLGKVPESLRPDVKIHKTTPAVEEEEAPPVPEIPNGEAAPELYGDHSLEWWLNTFRKIREEKQAIESSVAAKEQYINIFDGGRRVGQVYSREVVERYENFKKEVLADRERLKGFQDELDELTRKATIAGVPRAIREGR
ncbi:MAG: DUF4124 domain-containing protein [Deltaproteobacteria bacterium]|nr:DUF4124 domain-containing protein [Deltaproteobacteria bacterium]